MLTRHRSTATAAILNPVFQLGFASRSRAVDAAEDLSVRFDAVTDDAAVAVRANRRQRVNCALETVEGVTLTAHDDFERLVIFVFANFARRHTQLVRARAGSRRCLFRAREEIESVRPASSMPPTD